MAPPFRRMGLLGEVARPLLMIAFVLLAGYTYTSGLRAPASIAFVKDTLIYITVIAAIVIIPAQLGGWAHIFAVSQHTLAARPKPSSIFLSPPQYFAYATMAFGSSLSCHPGARFSRSSSDISLQTDLRELT